MKWALKNKIPSLPAINSVGDFASRRSFYHHPGIDIYCDAGQIVQSIENGKIVNIEVFTGPNATPPSPWWNETWSIMIEGKSGTIGYCELKPFPYLEIGSELDEGEAIGTIIPVLKKDKGNGTTMLHLEHYDSNTKEHVTWILDGNKPENLINPRELLEKIINEIF